MKKRILCILLALSMVLMLVPQAAFAATTGDGDFEYSVSGEEVTITKYLNTYATEVTIPDEIDGKDVTAIGDKAFFFSQYLKSVTIPDSVTSIGKNAFAYSQNLESITIPVSVTSIGENAFGYCYKLESIIVAEGNSNYSSVDGVLFNESQTELIAYPSGNNRTSYMIPTGVTSIGNNAFAYCYNLTSITIPDRVTSIGDNAFAECYELTNITIPKDVAFIGENAFLSCESLTSITVAEENQYYLSVDGVLLDKGKTKLIKYPSQNTGTSCVIPATVISIAGDAFANCHYLASITVDGDNPSYSSEYGVLFDKNKTRLIVCPSGYAGTSFAIPDDVTSIKEKAFSNCKKLERATIPDSVTLIGSDAFRRCTSLESINIPSGVTSIADSTFSGCESLKSITIPAGVTTIGDTAFWACGSLENIFLPNKDLSIGFLAIPDRTSQIRYSVDEANSKVTITKYNGNGTEVTIPDKIDGKDVTAIGDKAFFFSEYLESVTMPDTVTSIGENAFAYSRRLKSVTIPDSVTSIGKNAFDHCNYLTSITIPAGVTSIGENAFGYCYKLESIIVAEGNSNYSSVDGVLFNESQTELIAYPSGNNRTSYTIPTGVTSIGKNGLAYGLYLESIIIPDSVTSIGENAFADCYDLTSITIPDSVESIGDNAFANCETLTSINVDDKNQNYSSKDGVLFNKDKTVLIKYPFENTVTPYVISSNVTSIAEDAFIDCYNLTSIRVEDGNPNYSSVDGVLFDKDKTRLIVCPSGYAGTSFAIPDGVISIAEKAFSYCEKLESITIPASVTSIGEDVFWVCDSLESIFLPDTVQSIGNGAIPDEASQVKYSLDGATGEVTITEINLGTDKTSAAIPATICGYPVVAVAASEQSKVGTHTHRGGTATYTSRAVCDLCGKEYGDFLYYAPSKTDTVAPDKDGNVVVTIDKSNVTTDGKTEVTVSESVADTIVAQVASSESKKVIIDATTAKNTASEPVVAEPGHSTEVKLPEATVKKLAEMEDVEITIATDNGKVVLDQETVAAVAAKAGNDGHVTLVIETVEQNKNVLKIELKLQTSNGIVTDFNQGNVAVTVTVPKDMAEKKVVCVFIDENGKMSKVKGQKNADGTFTFVTGHFSIYAIMTEEEADTAFAAQKEETLVALADQQLTARSKIVTMKNGKKAVKITWYNENGELMDFDGVEIYRSTRRNAGYGKTPFFTTEKDAYYNTAIKKGTTYYYKVRGYVVIDGQKYYTDYSRKAIRIVK